MDELEEKKNAPVTIRNDFQTKNKICLAIKISAKTKRKGCA